MCYLLLARDWTGTAYCTVVHIMILYTVYCTVVHIMILSLSHYSVNLKSLSYYMIQHSLQMLITIIPLDQVTILHLMDTMEEEEEGEGGEEEEEEEEG